MVTKKTTILIIAITFCIAMTIFVVFFTSVFRENQNKIYLPQNSERESSGTGDDTVDTKEQSFASVNADTVKKVVSVMTRLDNYYRAMDVTTAGRTEHIEIWCVGEWSRTSITKDDTVKNIITDGKNIWIWYEGSENVYSGVMGEDFSADDEQHIPTYETLLKETHIQTADFLQPSDDADEPCIYAQAGKNDKNISKYWISTDTGLLIKAETSENGEVVYSMQQKTLESPINFDDAEKSVFVLPDGTVLN